MPNPPRHTIVERLAVLARMLCGAIAGQQIGRVLGGQIPGPLVLPLMERLKSIRDRFSRLAGRIVAGTYRPRHDAPREKPATPRLRTQTPSRQKFGWLDPLLPEAAQYRGHLLALLHDPEMAALVEVAPGPVARILRPLCWMLKVKPPPILAAPRRQPGTPPPAPSPRNTLGLYPIQLAPAGTLLKPA
jgi:hypothetical protein